MLKDCYNDFDKMKNNNFDLDSKLIELKNKFIFTFRVIKYNC